MLSEIKRSAKDKYCIIPLICSSQIHRHQIEWGGQELKGGENRNLFNG